MVKNKGSFYSDVEMGRALEPNKRISDESAIANYNSFLDQYDPDLLVLPGSPSREEAMKRAEGLATNARNFSERGSTEYEILTPEQELEWCGEILEETCVRGSANLTLSEDVLGRSLETSIDDVLAAHGATESGETVIYHTSQSHSRALRPAAEVVHQTDREYEVLGFGKDTLLDNFKQSVNSILQEHYYPRKRDF